MSPMITGTFDTFLFSFEDEIKLRDSVENLEKMTILSRSEFQGSMQAFLINTGCNNIQYALRLASNHYDHGVLLIDWRKRLNKRDAAQLQDLTAFVVKRLDQLFASDSSYRAEQNLLNSITKLKKDIIDIQSRIKKSNKLGTKDSASRLAQLAHDARSPLFILRNLSGQLSLSTPDKDTAEAIELMRNSVEKISHQLSFECQRPQEIIVSKTRLSKLLHESIQLCTSALSVKSVQFNYDIDVGDEMISHRRAYVIYRLLNNFLGNACKYTPHGTITLMASIKQSAVTYLSLKIKDTGIGIPTTVLRSLRQLESDIYQDNYLQLGSGLGLQICQQLLASIHGAIRVIDSSAKGTHIECKVPLSGSVEPLHSEVLNVPHD